MSEPRYLWLSTNAGLWPSFRLEHRLAEALARDGRHVTMVNCRGVLDRYCPVMAAEHLEVSSPRSLRLRACVDCRHNVEITSPRASYGSMWLDDFVTSEVRAWADTITEGVTPSNWSDLVVDDVPIGRYATYLSLLHHKVPDVTSTQESWDEYRADVRSSLLVLGAMPAMLEAERPTHAVVLNPLYPANRAFAEYALLQGLQLVNVAPGSYIPGRYESSGVYPHLMSSQTTTDSPVITESLGTPASPVEIRAVGAHLAELTGGNDPWVYSSAPRRLDPSEVRRQLGLRPESPVVVVLVSSPDETRSSMLVGAEYFRADDGEYSDIPEFIAAAIQAARDVPEVDVVFRLHPRLMPNKRERVVSPDLARITDLLSDLPPNAVVNGGGDGLSLYDVMLVADAALNQSSSAGLEFLTLGLPVVQYDPPRLGAYSRDFALLVERHDPEGLASALRSAVAQGWSLENSRRAFRWYTAVLLRALLHLSDVESTYATVDEAAPADVAPAPPSLALRTARRVLPASIRERWSRRAARAGREHTVPDPGSDTVWVAEWCARVDATVGTDPVWMPLMRVRGAPGDEASETLAVREQVVNLLSRLGVQDGPGLGALRTALRELGE